MVAKGKGTDGWHRELADSWSLNTLLFFGGVGGDGRAEESRQIHIRESKKMTTSPFPPTAECRGRSSQAEKEHSSSRRQDALLFIKSSPPASQPFIPLLLTRGQSHQLHPHAGYTWARHNSVTQKSPGMATGQSHRSRRRESRGAAGSGDHQAVCKTPELLATLSEIHLHLSLTFKTI